MQVQDEKADIKVLSQNPIDPVQLRFVCFLNGFASDIPFSRRPGKRLLGYDDDHICRSDPLVKVPPRVKLPSFTQYVFFELFVVNVRRRLDKQSGRRTPTSHDNAFCDKFPARCPHILFDGSNKIYRVNLHQSLVLHAETYFVSHRKLFSLLIQSSSRPRDT